jgi:hypothetical protein
MVAMMAAALYMGHSLPARSVQPALQAGAAPEQVRSLTSGPMDGISAMAA